MYTFELFSDHAFNNLPEQQKAKVKIKTVYNFRNPLKDAIIPVFSADEYQLLKTKHPEWGDWASFTTYNAFPQPHYDQVYILKNELPYLPLKLQQRIVYL